RWLLDNSFATSKQSVGVAATGERWPDKSLRPAVEDLLGATAVISALSTVDCSAEARIAARAGLDVDVAAVVWDSPSGRELREMSFAGNVNVATELDASDAVPVLRDRAFVSLP